MYSQLKLCQEVVKIFIGIMTRAQKRASCQQIQTKGGWTAQKPCSLYDLCHLHNPATPCRFYLRLFFSSGGTSWLYN